MPEPTDKDRRVSARFPVGNAHVDTRKIPLAFLQPNIAAKVLDVSETGARISTTSVVAIGQKLRVRIEFPNAYGVEKIDAIAKVVWVRAGRGTAVVGVDFVPESKAAVRGVIQRMKNPVRSKTTIPLNRDK